MQIHKDLLPIDNHKDDILSAIQDNQVVVIAGDTGSGKTTRIPQYCLELEHSQKGIIGCTQPRRLAAVSVAARVAEEVGDARLVNYKIRFHDHTTERTQIKFMTDGILLAETKNDPLLKKYSILIIDEAHERNLNIDFLLGYLKRILEKRQDLKLIITSATIDTVSFAQHFSNAPIISIEGRTYPVELRYDPLPEDEEEYLDHCTEAVRDLFQQDRPGDTLIFLPTEKDIRSCCDLLQKAFPLAEVLPLFGRLQGSDQRRIFQPCSAGKIAKIVVATNVAETSITVPGIRYVIDSGLARLTYYNVRSKTTSLPIRRVSQASCNQRMGRCGRVGPGICVRLYSEDDFTSRDEFTLPEIKRSNLADVLLQMSSLRLGDPAKFPFVDPPANNAIREGYRILSELGAVDRHYALTPRGKIMANLPIDPCISRLLIEANENNCLKEVKIIAAVLSIQDPRIRPAEKEKEADAAHKEFAHKHSDFMSLLAIWEQFHALEGEKSWSKLKRFCKSHYLSFQRMREWMDLHDQLCRILKRYKEFHDNQNDASYPEIHKSLLTGYLRNIAMKQEKKIYQGAGNKELMIFPGSCIFSSSGQWIMAATFLETGRLYALMAANIENEWIEPIAGKLCKYSWTNPRWEKKTGQVIADEKVTLFGLTIVASRKVNFGRVHTKNHKEARDIFIESALLTGEIIGKFSFLRQNVALIEKWQDTEERLRRRDIVQNDAVLHAFYAERLPENVFDKTSLIRFLRDKKNHNLLVMTEQDVVMTTPEQNAFADFPATISANGMTLKCTYQFDPAGKRDGLSIHVPVHLAPTLSAQHFDWLVPGFLQEKVTLLLKGLPKSLRKKLVPVNMAVDRLLDEIHSGDGRERGASLLANLESAILKHYRFSVQRSDWPTEFPSHLTPHFILEGETGKEVSAGRDLRGLVRAKPQIQASKNTQLKPDQKTLNIINKWQGFEAKEYAFAGLESRYPLYAGKNIAGFLYTYIKADKIKGSVTVGFTKDNLEAETYNREGVLFLYQMYFSAPLKSLRKLCANAFTAPSAAWLVKEYPSKREVTDALLRFILQNLFPPSPSLPREEVFMEQVEQVKNIGLYKIGSKICNNFSELIRMRKDTMAFCETVFAKRKNGNGAVLYKKFCSLIDELLSSKVLEQTELLDLVACTRQFKSLQVRLERFNTNPDKDAQKEKQLLPHLKNIENAEKNQEYLSEEAIELVALYKRLVAEYRISVFSPEIKTTLSVSAKKLEKQWIETKAFI